VKRIEGEVRHPGQAGLLTWARPQGVLPRSRRSKFDAAVQKRSRDQGLRRRADKTLPPTSAGDPRPGAPGRPRRGERAPDDGPARRRHGARHGVRERRDQPRPGGRRRRLPRPPRQHQDRALLRAWDRRAGRRSSSGPSSSRR
jgi:hypothetical protein